MLAVARIQLWQRRLGSSQTSRIRFALYKAAASGRAKELAWLRCVVDDEFAAGEHLGRVAFYGPAFEH